MRLGVSHIAHGVAAKVGARQIVQDALGGICWGGELACGFELLEAALIWEAFGWCCSQLGLHVGIYDAGGQRRYFGAIGFQGLF